MYCTSTSAPFENSMRGCLSRQRLAPDPIYEAYVADAGITGLDNFDIIGNYCCG